jgi:uncharacterized protein YeaO (DUF488 family)
MASLVRTSKKKLLNLISPLKKQGVKRAEHNDSLDLWNKPLEPTPALKKALQHFKGKFDENKPWDGDFYL